MMVSSPVSPTPKNHTVLTCWPMRRVLTRMRMDVTNSMARNGPSIAPLGRNGLSCSREHRPNHGAVAHRNRHISASHHADKGNKALARFELTTERFRHVYVMESHPVQPLKRRPRKFLPFVPQDGIAKGQQVFGGS